MSWASQQKVLMSEKMPHLIDFSLGLMLGGIKPQEMNLWRNRIMSINVLSVDNVDNQRVYLNPGVKLLCNLKF